MAKQSSKKEASSTTAREPELIFLNQDYPTLYSNHVNVSWTGLEIELIFGEIKESDDEKVKVKRNIGIYMSPVYAKAVAAALADGVENYEKQFGELLVMK